CEFTVKHQFHTVDAVESRQVDEVSGAEVSYRVDGCLRRVRSRAAQFEVESIIAGATGQHIRIESADQKVVSGPTDQRVVAIAADQDVIGSAAYQQIIAVIPLQRVRSTSTVQDIGASTARDDVIEIGRAS